MCLPPFLNCTVSLLRVVYSWLVRSEKSRSFRSQQGGFGCVFTYRTWLIADRPSPTAASVLEKPNQCAAVMS